MSTGLQTQPSINTLPRYVSSAECGWGGCTKPIEAGGLCAGHRKRKVRTGDSTAAPVRRYSRTPFAGIAEAALAYADAAAEGSDEDFKRAEWRFRAALKFYQKRSVRTKD